MEGYTELGTEVDTFNPVTCRVEFPEAIEVISVEFAPRASLSEQISVSSDVEATSQTEKTYESRSTTCIPMAQPIATAPSRRRRFKNSHRLSRVAWEGVAAAIVGGRAESNIESLYAALPNRKLPITATLRAITIENSEIFFSTQSAGRSEASPFTSPLKLIKGGDSKGVTADNAIKD